MGWERNAGEKMEGDEGMEEQRRGRKEGNVDRMSKR
jgi:hypothetical protein